MKVLIFATAIVLLMTSTAAFQGDLTYYSPEAGITACGTRHTSSESIAALSFADFGNAPNPNTSPTCNLCARISANGKSAVVRIRDKCAGCKSGDIDVTISVFSVFADPGVGRMSASWDFVPCSGNDSGSGGEGNYCGLNFPDSMKCAQRCPGGVDRECPAGERCYAQVPC